MLTGLLILAILLIILVVSVVIIAAAQRSSQIGRLDEERELRRAQKASDTAEPSATYIEQRGAESDLPAQHVDDAAPDRRPTHRRPGHRSIPDDSAEFHPATGYSGQREADHRRGPVAADEPDHQPEDTPPVHPSEPTAESPPPKHAQSE